MLTNYLRVALRSLRRQKGFATINVLGLAVGIAGALLVGLFVRHELTFDRFHENSDRVYRPWTHHVGENQDNTNSMTPRPLGPTLQAAFPEIEAMTRYEPRAVELRRGTASFAQGVAYVDPSFFQVLSFPFVAGDPETALQRPDGIVLSDSAAGRLFGDADPLGQSVVFRTADQDRDVVVTGVVEVPVESSTRFDGVVPYALALTGLMDPAQMDTWFSISGETYVLLREGTDAAALEAKFPPTITTALPETGSDYTYTVHLQPLLDIHLNPDIPQGAASVRDPQMLWILAGIAALLLLVASINFTTLSLGRSLDRAREVGVRKALGAHREQLMGQFWGEAALLTTFALLSGLLLALLGRPLFNELAQETIPFRLDGGTLLLLLGVGLVVALVAGAYPALVLSRFQPTETLRGRLRVGTGGGVQRGLVAVQFALSIGLVASTLVMGSQLRFLQTQSLGYEPGRVIVLPNAVAGIDSLEALEPFRTALSAEPAVAAVSGASLPMGAWASIGYDDRDGGPPHTFRMNSVAPDYLATMEIPLVAGAGFSPIASTAARQVVVNRAFVTAFELGDSPIGQPLPEPLSYYTVAGVTDDFHYQSLREGVEPALLVTERDSLISSINSLSIPDSPAMDVIVRLGAGPLPEALAAVEQAFTRVAPERPFEYEFLDEGVARQYREEARLGRIVTVASVLAIFVAALGLFGLAALTAAQRTKEVGVRKVLGASVGSLVALLSKDLARLVMVGFVLAAPAAWWVMDRWLTGYAYHIDLGPWLFLAAGGLALAIALLVTSFHTLRAAAADPVRALRAE